MNRGTHIWAVPEDAVGCEPVSAPNSLLTGKLTGNLPISGVSAANLTTSLRACARPDRATWAACRRRRGDRVVFFCCDCSQPLLALLGPHEMSDLSPQSGPKRTLVRSFQRHGPIFSERKGRPCACGTAPYRSARFRLRPARELR